MVSVEEKYVTVVGMSNYFGCEILDIGQIIILKKDHENLFDDDAIVVYLNRKIKVGYVANSVNTVARGTKSASRIYDNIKEEINGEVMFKVRGCVIVKIVKEE